MGTELANYVIVCLAHALILPRNYLPFLFLTGERISPAARQGPHVRWGSSFACCDLEPRVLAAASPVR